MAGSDYISSNIRFGLDGASSITWQAACDVSISDWALEDLLIVAAFGQAGAHASDPESFQLRWRNKTDNPTGSFATLVTGSGELRAGASAGAITNTDPIGASAGCQTTTADEEIENESPLQSGTIDTGNAEYFETQWCIDFSNALNNKEYEFELYSVTAGASIGNLTYTVTTIAGAGPSIPVVMHHLKQMGVS